MAFSNDAAMLLRRSTTSLEEERGLERYDFFPLIGRGVVLGFHCAFLAEPGGAGNTARSKKDSLKEFDNIE